MESKNKIGVAALDSKLPRAQRAKLSNNPIINNLLKNTVKQTSYAYSSAIARAKLSPLDELQRRVFKRLRHMYGSDRYMALQNHVSALSPLERQDWLNDMQDKLNAIKQANNS
tara:strand:+ start:180 stop:518 length:339 start_codon:yes stop_codon:yes gene_type:complete